MFVQNPTLITKIEGEVETRLIFQKSPCFFPTTFLSTDKTRVMHERDQNGRKYLDSFINKE